MYLAIILMPLVGSVISGFFGRKIGVTGSHLITCSSVIFTTVLAIISFVETALNNSPVSFYLFKWLDSESLNTLWAFNFDSLTVSMLIPVLIVSSLVHVYSIGYMSNDPHNQRFFSYLSLFTFMMIILVTANSYLLMFVGWEGVGICSYLLVSFWFTRIAANQSSISAILTNRVGDCFLTIGMFAIIWSLGNLDYATVYSISPFISEDIITIIGICLLLGAMAKSSQLGLHIWLPMAMEGPTPVSALIHAATMVTAGVYLLIRSSPLIEYSSTVLLLCLWIGAITSIFSSLIGLFQQDIKKVIAYSTMSQLGLMVVSVGLSSYCLALYHLINHAFYKALLFLSAGSVIHGVEDNQDFRKYGGLKQFLPLSYSVMLIASLSLVAFPFMTGFYSKDFILESSYGQFQLSGIAVYYIATIGAMFTTLYSIKTLYLSFITNPNGPLINYIKVHEGNIYMSISLVILAIFSIFFGFITKDMFIGLGSDLFTDNSIFIHPAREIMINTEFAVPTFYKLLPLILTVSLTIISLIISEYLFKNLMKFKFSRSGYNIFSFFNLRFLIEFIYNKYIIEVIFKLGGQTTKVLDKGSIEYIGPYGIEKSVYITSKILSYLDKGIVTTYAVYILVGGLSYMLITYLSLFNYSTIIIISLLNIIIIVDRHIPTYYVDNPIVVESSIFGKFMIFKKLAVFKKFTINRLLAIVISGIIVTSTFGTLSFIFISSFGIEIDWSHIYTKIGYFLGGGVTICTIKSTLTEIIHHYLNIYFNSGKLTMTLEDAPDNDELKKSHIIAMEGLKDNSSSSNNPSSTSNPSSSGDPSSSNNPSSSNPAPEDAFADFDSHPDFKRGWHNDKNTMDEYNKRVTPEERNEDVLLRTARSNCGSDDTPFERFAMLWRSTKRHAIAEASSRSVFEEYMINIGRQRLPIQEYLEAERAAIQAREQSHRMLLDVTRPTRNSTQEEIMQARSQDDRDIMKQYGDAKRRLPQWPKNHMDASREGKSCPQSPSQSENNS